MKNVFLFIALASALSSSASASDISRLTQISFGGKMVQPCLSWWTNGSCAQITSDFDAADRKQVNAVIDQLEAKIRRLEKKMEEMKQ